jgi:putative membrane protein
MRWGILFRKEVILNYSRIQDIHLSSNVVERWLGLAKLEIQTASGSATAEMTLEGLLQFEAIRDFIYTKMRGIKEAGLRPANPSPEPALQRDASSAELVEALGAVAEELRATRLALERRAGSVESSHD